MIEITDEQMREALQKSCDEQVKLLEKAKEIDENGRRKKI